MRPLTPVESIHSFLGILVVVVVDLAVVSLAIVSLAVVGLATVGLAAVVGLVVPCTSFTPRTSVLEGHLGLCK